MRDTVAVIIATFGDREQWNVMSMRALASVSKQVRPPDQVIRYHGANIREARNWAGGVATCKWLCFLDADDELEPNYLWAMTLGSGDLRYPRVRYVSESIVDPACFPEPQILKPRPLLSGNYMVIGTLVERERFLRVGGFDDYPVFEDWALWIKCWMDGAKPQLIRDAVYRAYRRRGSRNISPVGQQTFDKILRDAHTLAVQKGIVQDAQP